MCEKPLVVALTGGIASGKSKVCKLFENRGIKIIDADSIARELLAPNSPHLSEIKNQFGDKVFKSKGVLDRKALGKIVFSDPLKLQWLNNYTHPLVFKEILRQLKQTSSPYLILDIPLLIDIKGHLSEKYKPLINRILVINTSKENQLKRLISRDKITSEYAEEIISSQSTLEQKLVYADDTIDNNGLPEKLDAQVEQLDKKYRLICKSQ